MTLCLFLYILLICIRHNYLPDAFDTLMDEYVQCLTDRQLNCCDFFFSLRCWFQLKEECESADGYPCIDRRLDLKLIIIMTDTCKWLVILQMFGA